MVLPLSSMSGSSWNASRVRWRRCYDDITVVTIAGPGSQDSSFSAYTGIAECLLVASRAKPGHTSSRATFVMLREQVQSAVVAELLGAEILRLKEEGRVQRLEDAAGVTQVSLGAESFGVAINATLPESGSWPLVGIVDWDLALAASNLASGTLLQIGLASEQGFALPVVPIEEMAGRGPVDRDINGVERDGTIRGPFDIVSPPISPEPTFPMLWAHAAKLERRLIVQPDSEGHVRSASVGASQPNIDHKATNVWNTATRAHYNRDLRFNSQSLIVAMTERPCIGGMAWPSVVFRDTAHEYAFSLWCNSTLGLLLHWWFAEQDSQSGRGTDHSYWYPQIFLRLT